MALRALGVGVGAGRYDDRPDLATLRRLARLRERNLRSRDSVLGDAPAVVVMTTTASRIAFAWAALESIAAGSRRPQRLILWLDDPSLTTLPRSIARLERRGLEVRHVAPGLGVHTKWRPHALSEPSHALPMVTSDDDQLYPHGWLAELLETAAAHPTTVIAHRAHEVSVEGDRIGSYLSWTPIAHVVPSYAAFGTSVSGQLLPSQLVDALRDRGDGFLALAPHQDDVWLHATAVASGFRTVQVRPQSANYPFVPGTQSGGLYIGNVFGDGNDRAVAACLGPEERARIIADRSRSLPGAAH